MHHVIADTQLTQLRDVLAVELLLLPLLLHRVRVAEHVALSEQHETLRRELVACVQHTEHDHDGSRLRLGCLRHIRAVGPQIVVTEVLRETRGTGPGRAQQHDLVLLALPALEVLQQHLEAGLVIRRHLRRLEVEALLRLQRAQVRAEGTEDDRPRRVEPLHDLVDAVDQLVRIALVLLREPLRLEGRRQLRVVLHLLHPRLEALAKLGFDRRAPLPETIRLIEEEQGPLIEIIEEAHLLLLAGCAARTIGRRVDLHAVQGIDRALRLRVEGSDAVDLRVPELDADRILRGERVDVDDTAADRVLAHRVDLDHALVAEARQLRGERLHLHHHPRLDRQHGLREILPSEHPVHECVNAGDHDAAVVLHDVLQHLDALPGDERTLGIRLIEEEILRRIVPGLLRKGMDVAHEALARRLVLHDQQLPRTLHVLRGRLRARLPGVEGIRCR